MELTHHEDLEQGEHSNGGLRARYIINGPIHPIEMNSLPGQADVSKAKITLRLVNLIIIIALIIPTAIMSKATPHTFYITSSYDTANVPVGTNADLEYPIKLAGSWCVAADMVGCTTASTSTCCTEFNNPNSSGPEVLVPTTLLDILCVLLPFLVLITRAMFVGDRESFFWRKTFGRASSDPGCASVSLLNYGNGNAKWRDIARFSCWDTYLGQAMAIVLAVFLTAIAKIAVGRPRPSYYALLYFAQFGAKGLADSTYRDKEERDAIASWFSGHASTSVAGTLFCGLVLWRDTLVLRVKWRKQPHFRLLTGIVLCRFVISVLVMLSLLIGVSRIIDYKHRPDDVVTGWLFGFGSAIYAWRHIACISDRYPSLAKKFEDDQSL